MSDAPAQAYHDTAPAATAARLPVPLTKMQGVVIAFRELGPAAGAVYAVIADHCFGDRIQCWPSKDTIVEQTGLHVSNVKRGIRKLEAAGIIQVERGHGRTNTNTYTLIIAGKGRTSAPLSDRKKGRTSAPKKGAPARPESRKEGESGVEALKGSTPDEHWEDAAPALNGGAGPPAHNGAGMAIAQLVASSASRKRLYQKTADQQMVDHQRKQEVVREQYGFTKADEIEAHRNVVRPGNEGNTQAPPGNREGDEGTRGQPEVAIPAERSPSPAEGV